MTAAPRQGSGVKHLSDRWILSRAPHATARTRACVGDFALNEGAKTVYDFVWHEFCDWYLELSKERFYSEEAGEKREAILAARPAAHRLKTHHAPAARDPILPILKRVFPGA